MSIPRNAAILSAVSLSAVLLAGCGGSSHDLHPSTLTSPTTLTAEPTPLETAVEDSDVVPADMRVNIVDSVSSGNTAALEGYLAPTVHITYCASEDEGDVTDHDLVIDDITLETASGASWDFDLAPSVVKGYHDSSEKYYDDFPPGAVVGLSSENKVLSFTIADELITRVFVCHDAAALG